ncbi:metallophosphoesterase family protein [Leadbettera azotonutricia]|uniref:Nuclease SbcCD subunit D n=1 Tax=Leadbettera azotonutricia (strain ATCC BAA-888 / DSM 13862 / ZAS-9) TaxID=545695 RepID=F5YCE4_LEAAZ|nr:exonuclease SbcCD subunit D [Leadbettera azotonutricia]AEF80763.1 nuclease SbcCD, D subunit [Leadbettera azotonutricia ZAS-9]
MLKFLHTADLHLGKLFHDQNLEEDQKFMLRALAGILSDPSYKALIIAGDVYDRSIPSPGAMDLFGSFLGDVKARNPNLIVMVIPGNHDSPLRLGYGRELFSPMGVKINSNPDDCCNPVIVGEGDEGCAFFLLPFLNPGSFMGKDGAPIHSQEKLAVLAAKKLEDARLECKKKGINHSVLLAHLFASGGKESESERIFLGNAEQVNMGIFSGFDYAALGHLHRYQKAGKNGWYSGSPLAYSFGEAGTDKVFLSVELGEAGPKVTPVPIEPLRKVSRLEGAFDWLQGEALHDPEIQKIKNDYLEINLTDKEIKVNAMAFLKSNYPYILNINQKTAFDSVKRGNNEAFEAALPSGERRDTAGDFAVFLEELYGGTDEQKLSLFKELLAEAEAAEIKA